MTTMCIRRCPNYEYSSLFKSLCTCLAWLSPKCFLYSWQWHSKELEWQRLCVQNKKKPNTLIKITSLADWYNPHPRNIGKSHLSWFIKMSLLHMLAHLSRSLSMMSSMLLYWQKRSTRCWLTMAEESPASCPSPSSPIPHSCSRCLWGTHTTSDR